MGLRKSIRKKIGKWSRKGMPKKTKEMWHFPKRSSIEQMKGIIKILTDLDLNNKAWGLGNKDKVNRELARRNLTQSGTMLSSSAFGTLIALVKYFGYIFIKDGKIIITNAGETFLKNPTSQFKEQILKLEITNPLILKDCENIFVFPFKEVLKLLLKLQYLTIEEIGYIVFMKFKKEKAFRNIFKEILNFRSLPEKERSQQIEEFNKTPEGNVALGQAPTVGYFIAFFLHANFCNRIKVDGKFAIKPKNKKEIKSLLDKYAEAMVFNFKDNMNLWIEYIGEPSRVSPPREIIIKFKNPAQREKLILIYQSGKQIEGDVINAVNEMKVSLFDNEIYFIEIFELKNGSNIGTLKVSPSKGEKEIVIDLKKVKPPGVLSKKDWAILINKHIQSPDFDSAYRAILKTLRNTLNLKIKDGRLRGGRLECLVFKLLEQLEKEGLINNLKWNGSIKKYGIAQPAPGLLPDITFNIKGIHFVLELTTIKPRSTQWSAEGASVPDHIRVFSERNKNKKVVGIFCAPLQYKRNIKILKNSLRDERIPVLCYEVDELISILLSKDPLNEFLKDIT